MNLPWHIVKPLDMDTFNHVRRAAIFQCCKWDAQVEDTCVLSPAPLVLTRQAWRELTVLAEGLAEETMRAEIAILDAGLKLRELGLPWALCRRLRGLKMPEGGRHHLRLVRFDFHFTTDGWRISEANSDVPGGFNEASGLSRLLAEHFPSASAPADPVEELVREIRKATRHGGTVALVHATAYSDDRQVMTHLARHLEVVGLFPVLISPDQLRWADGRAFVETDWFSGAADFVFRFFPAEWLPPLPRCCAWWHLLGGATTPLCNPASAVLTQSKRFPLLWPELPVRLPAWKQLLPTTCDPRQADAILKGAGILKPALGRVGDMIEMAGVTSAKDSQKIRRAAKRHPRYWVAQQRFEAVPLEGPGGPLYPCIGVYTLNGRVIGAYGRVARRPLIDHRAEDTAVLVMAEKPAGLEQSHHPHESDRVLQPLGA